MGAVGAFPAFPPQQRQLQMPLLLLLPQTKAKLPCPATPATQRHTKATEVNAPSHPPTFQLILHHKLPSLWVGAAAVRLQAR